MRPLRLAGFVAALVVGVAIALALVTRGANNEPSDDGRVIAVASLDAPPITATRADGETFDAAPTPAESVEETAPVALSDLAPEAILELIRQSDDPLLRRALFEKSGLLNAISSIEEAERIGLLALVRDAETDGAFFEYLRLFADSGAPWAQEFIVGLGATEDKRGAVARAFLLTREEYWAEAGYRQIIAEEDSPWRVGALQAALNARGPWALPMLWETYEAAPASEQVYWVRWGLLEHPVNADHPRVRLFEGAVREGDAATLRAAVDFFTRESHLMNPGGERWSVDLLLDNFAVLTPEGQVLMLEAVPEILADRSDLQDISVGNVTAMNALLEAGRTSAHAQVRAATDAAVASLEALFDVDAARAQIAEDIARLDVLRAELAP